MNKRESTSGTTPKPATIRAMRARGLAKHTEQTVCHIDGDTLITTITTQAHYDCAWDGVTGEPVAAYIASKHTLIIPTEAYNEETDK